MKPTAAFLTGLLLAAALPFAAAAQTATPRSKAVADPLIAGQLKALKYQNEIDEDGDYKLVFDLGGPDKRTQLVFVRSAVESYDDQRVREIWSVGYASPTEDFPAPVANRLLTATMDSKMGGWGKQGKNAIFIVRIPANADAKMLDAAITAAVHSADQMEAELTPGKDDL